MNAPFNFCPGEELTDRAEKIAPAFYLEKEAWKNEPGNRYTPAELLEMDRHWNVHLFNPDRATCRSVD